MTFHLPNVVITYIALWDASSRSLIIYYAAVDKGLIARMKEANGNMEFLVTVENDIKDGMVE
jgi:hypothetical protein